MATEVLTMTRKKPATADDWREKLAELDAVIGSKQLAASELRTSIPQLIADAPNSELVAARERKRLAELSDELTHLHGARAVLTAHLDDAVRREYAARWEVQRKAARAKGEELVATAAELQRQLASLWPLAVEFQAKCMAFSASLPRQPRDFEPSELVGSVPTLLGLAFFTLSDGKLRPRGVIETPHDLKESGRADFVQRAKDLIAVGLRGSEVAPALPSTPQPPAAA